LSNNFPASSQCFAALRDLLAAGATGEQQRRFKWQFAKARKGEPMLCYKCTGRIYTCDVGSCSQCGAFTSSGMFNYCSPCATKLNKCSACDGQLDAVKPEVPADAKLSCMVSVNVEHYRGPWKQTATRKGQARRNRKAFRAWRQDVKDLLNERGWAQDSVKVVTELPYIAVLYVECTKEVSEALAEMPGTAALSTNDPVY
jgi:hypothetical protein